MKFKNIAKLITYPTLISLLYLTPPASPQTSTLTLGKICYRDRSAEVGKQLRCVSSLETDLDDDGEKEFLTIGKLKESDIIGEYCGYMFKIKDPDFMKDRTITWDIFNIARVDLDSENYIKLHICTTESEEGLTGIGEPSIIAIKNYKWNGEKLEELK